MSKRGHNNENTGTIQARLNESDVFITEYVNNETTFSAIIKQRFSDFQVFEIDEDGNEVHLTSIENNLSESKAVSDEEEYENVDIDEIPVSQLSYPIDDAEKWRQLTLLMKRKNKKENIKIDVTGIDKNERTKIHTDISKRYKTALCTKTVEEKDHKFIVVSTNKNIDYRKFEPWPKDTPKFLHFVLYKENLDTVSAVRLLCKLLKTTQKSVSYTGTKDKRGVTTQRVCIRQITAERVCSISKYNLWCGNFEYKDSALKLGQLRGNRFIIALRNVTSSDAVIKSTLQSLAEKGFINYYGLQRFGSYLSAPTFEIGKYLLQQCWLQAINLILTPPPFGDREGDLRRAISIWKSTGDAKAAVKFIRKNYSTEGIILRTLAEQGNTAYVNALQKIPRNIVLLYLHAFQSLVWNRIVSQRIKKYGMEVLPGDLVFVCETVEVLDVDDVEDDESEPKNLSEVVHVLSPDEASKTSIYDVVYPLPGYAIKYPENEVAKWYEEILQEYKINDFKGKNKSFNSPGAYRKMFMLPKNVNWKTIFYNEPSADLLPTELQKLKNELTIQNLENGSYKAVIVEFTLPSCSYATMALREVTKADTSASYQASLSSDHIQNKKMKCNTDGADAGNDAD